MSSASLEVAIARYFATAPPEVEPCCEHAVALARHVAFELSLFEARALARHLAACAECRALLDELEQTAGVWRGETRAWRRWLGPALAAGLALVVAAAALVGGQRADPDRLVPKGAFSLDVAVRRGGQQFLAPSGSHLQQGDQLGLFYSSARAGYLTVLYADDRAPPVRVFPAREPRSARVAAGQNLPLSDGVVLADGSGCEWVIAVFTSAPLEAAGAAALAQQLVSARAGCALGEAPQGAGDVQVVVVHR